MLCNTIYEFIQQVVKNSLVSGNMLKKRYSNKNRLGHSLILFMITFTFGPALCQINQETQTDTLSKKQIRIQKRIEFKKAENRYFIRLGYVFAHLDTDISFELPDTYLIAKVGLEDDFSLPENKSFFTASYIHRITPASGIYVNYYGIKRRENRQTQREIIFHRDTIPAGLNNTAYFNTQVISTGYLFSIKQDPGAFLAAYFNIYFMRLDTGVKSEIGDIDSQVGLVAPLPNIGLIGMFKLNRWLYLNGNVGFFSIKTNDLSGALYSFSIELMSRPVKWFAVDLSYQEFDIQVGFPYKNINTTVNYNFSGPAVGLSFSF